MATAVRTRKPTGRSTRREVASKADPRWTFLSNHSHVLICLHQEPDLTLREVADQVGITERSVQRILGELEEAGYLTRERRGLRNEYRFRTTAPLRHPIEAHCRIGDLIDMVESGVS
jgi:DNA-binding MarR family transcriptional regulator